jgi:RNA polymerase sigma-70 factor, ECF subfamily
LSIADAAVLTAVQQPTAPDAGSRIATVSDDSATIAPARLDPESSRWVRQLQEGHPRRDETVARLRALLVRVATHELARRRSQLGSVAGPEFDDLAEQAADDALVSIIAKVGEFRGLSRFTTWAYKFVIFEVSGKVARHAWQRHPPTPEELTWERLPDSLTPRPADRAEQREQLDALADGISALTERQRQVFVAIALNDVPIDVLAVALRSNRNAIYKNLFDARRRLRAHLAAAGHPVTEDDALPR